MPRTQPIKSRVRKLGRPRRQHARPHVRQNERKSSRNPRQEELSLVAVVIPRKTHHHLAIQTNRINGPILASLTVVEISMTIVTIDLIILIVLHLVSILMLGLEIASLPLLFLVIVIIAHRIHLMIVINRASHHPMKVSILPIGPIAIITRLDAITDISILIDITTHPNLICTRNDGHDPGLLLLLAKPRTDVIHDPLLEKIDEVNDIVHDLRSGEIVVIVIDDSSGQAKSTTYSPPPTSPPDG